MQPAVLQPVEHSATQQFQTVDQCIANRQESESDSNIPNGKGDPAGGSAHNCCVWVISHLGSIWKVNTMDCAIVLKVGHWPTHYCKEHHISGACFQAYALHAHGTAHSKRGCKRHAILSKVLKFKCSDKLTKNQPTRGELTRCSTEPTWMLS